MPRAASQLIELVAAPAGGASQHQPPYRLHTKPAESLHAAAAANVDSHRAVSIDPYDVGGRETAGSKLLIVILELFQLQLASNKPQS